MSSYTDRMTVRSSPRLTRCATCGEPIPDTAERWPAADSNHNCQMCWEAECGRTWWDVMTESEAEDD